MKYPLSKNYGAGSILFGDEERKELMDVLETGYLFRYGEDDDPNFQGKVYKFEREYAEYVGAEYCVATNSGTTSLLCALAALGIGPGDEVIVPGYTYIASISSIVNSRAVPVLAEIDESMTIDPEDIKKKITPKTKAIMPVHMIGNPCRMDEIMAIAKEHGLYVIEDCCQCVGGSYKGKKVGTFGEIGCFSFNRFKTINCGDGGCMVTSDKDLYERAFAFQDQGNVPLRKGTKEGPRTIMGLNYRMNELSGAACRGQLRRLDYIVSTLKKNKAMIKNELKKIDGVKFRVINDEDGEINTLLTLQFDTVEKADKFAGIFGYKTQYYSGWHVYDHMEHLLSHSMPTKISCPWDCPYYGKEMNYQKGMLPRTTDILRRSVSVGIGLSDKSNGVGIGINVLSTEEDVRNITEKLINALKQVL